MLRIDFKPFPQAYRKKDTSKIAGGLLQEPVKVFSRCRAKEVDTSMRHRAGKLSLARARIQTKARIP
jgi:hypothetical protein